MRHAYFFTARPDIQIQVNTETINGLHYQSVLCSAVGGKPQPQISWLVRGLPASDHPFTVDARDTVHSNGTSTLSSVLRFPTHLQDQDSVTCVVQHPTFLSPKHTTVSMGTYSKPSVLFCLHVLAVRCDILVITGQSFCHPESWRSISQQLSQADFSYWSTHTHAINHIIQCNAVTRKCWKKIMWEPFTLQALHFFSSVVWETLNPRVKWLVIAALYLLGV